MEINGKIHASLKTRWLSLSHSCSMFTPLPGALAEGKLSPQPGHHCLTTRASATDNQETQTLRKTRIAGAASCKPFQQMNQPQDSFLQCRYNQDSIYFC